LVISKPVYSNANKLRSVDEGVVSGHGARARGDGKEADGRVTRLLKC